MHDELYLADAFLVSQDSRQLPSDENVTCTLCDLSTTCRRKVELAWELVAFFVEVQAGEPSLDPREQLGEVPNHNRHTELSPAAFQTLWLGWVYFL